MSWVVRFAKSSIGAKFVMALTGTVLVLFVLGHMLGNLQIFLGQDAYNAYAHFLKGQAELLWLVRLGLLAAVLLHIASGIRLNRLNAAARPKAYHNKRFIKASFTSRTMMLSGLVLMAFIVYHLLHFTLGVVSPNDFGLSDPKGRADVYTMFVRGFQNVYIAWSYIIAMVLLGMHLNHGASSMFQTLGINHPRYNGLIHRFGPAFAILVVVGNCSMPLAVQLGLITLPAGGV